MEPRVFASAMPSKVPHPRADFNQSMKGVGRGFALSGTFAAVGGLVMGTGKLLRTGRQSQKEGNGFQPDWPQVVESAIVSARASFTAGGFAEALARFGMWLGLGRSFAEAGVTAEAAIAAKQIPFDSRLVKVLNATSTMKYAGNPLFQAAVLGSVVAFAGGVAVFVQRLSDTAMVEWRKNNGAKPDVKASAKSAVKVAGIGFLAGGVASLLRPLLGKALSP